MTETVNSAVKRLLGDAVRARDCTLNSVKLR